ncbi:LOW QUALITY PROTEIN: nardilysin-like [Mycetomoellerius zeteki]|uniref:LOW QUALITY PROTEIN: nardilysin-like n=1 Tax=Mycetomoellerius zeteki TaxID=64791 RepID=UPI00084E6628|nr:PREDICTED: LOW QUALITY PROTEIN: nardilysin-like [Trachymyrmex zeteki]
MTSYSTDLPNFYFDFSILDVMEKMACTTGNNERYRVEYLETPIKSKDDKKEYRAIRLPNGLEALLISDEHVKIYSSQDQDKINNKKAACCLYVGVGSFSDPPEVPRIAHFFERMLFFGFGKYPKYNLEAFIYNHGGTCGYSVDFEHTTFFFDIQEKNFLSALIHFAKFFTDPLLKTYAYKQELKAIENEFQIALFCAKNLRELLFSSFARTGHPANKFTGDTLVQLNNNPNYDKVNKELLKFKERHYSAHRMKLVIQVGLPLDTLEKYVTTYFGDVPTNGLPSDDFTEFKDVLPFDTPVFRKIYKVDASKLFRLEVTWAMPSLLDPHKSKPYEYISRSIEQEGKGSLISYLRKKMWICTSSKRAFYCNSKHNSMYSLVELIVELSREGFQHLDKILNAIFSFINLLKREGVQKRIFDEFCKSEENSFRFVDEENPLNYVKNLCKNMHFYSPCYYIAGNCSFIHFEYDPEAIQKCLNYLVPETANFMIFNKDFDHFEMRKVEPWLKTKYIDIEVPKEWIERWKSIEPLPDFHLPLPNIFLPSDFSLIPISAKVPKYPVKLYSNSISEVWYRPNPKFRLSKCHMNMHLISSLGFQSSENAALIRPYRNILELLLVEELYPAIQAGYNYKIRANEKGIVLTMSGFNEKLSLLLMTIAKCMVDCPNRVTEDMFEMVKMKELSIYYNVFIKPENLADDVRLWILKNVYYTCVDKYNALININFEGFQRFAKSFTDYLYIQYLVQGNMMQNTVIEIVQQFAKIINCSPLPSGYNPIQQIKIARLPLGTSYCKLKNINKLDANSVVMQYYQADHMSIELLMLNKLMIMIMEPSLLQWQFQENLHHVSCDFRDTKGIAGYCIIVHTQENKYTSEHVDQQIDKFFKMFKHILEEISENQLDDIKEIVTKDTKQYIDINIEEEVKRNWSEITKCQYRFDRIERNILALQKIKINELREWFAKHILNENYFRKLSIHIVGNDLKKVQYLALDVIDDQQHNQIHHIINEIDDYKKKLNIHPVIEG